MLYIDVQVGRLVVRRLPSFGLGMGGENPGSV